MAKKVFCLITLCIMLLLTLNGVSLATGWNTVDTSTSSPHLGFTTSTNLCKTCHAVHGANADSYRLLHDNSRTNECNYCHEGTSGVSGMKPYRAVGGDGIVRGEHSLGTSAIPDSDVNGGSGGNGNLPNRGDGGYGLNCYDCHTVHGAGRVTSVWPTRILRRDPAGNGGDVSNGIPGQNSGTGEFAVKSAFCADCHNLNPNWTVWGEQTDNRPNPRSHPTYAEGEVDIYGVRDVVGGAVYSCMSCHTASSYPLGISDFPHRSVGVKFLGDSIRNADQMDKACLSTCHGSVGTTY